MTKQDDIKFLRQSVKLAEKFISSFETPEEVQEKCDECGGTGYAIIEGVHADGEFYQWDVRCKCNPKVERDYEPEQ